MRASRFVDPSTPGGGAPTGETAADGEALRDAEAIADRVAADEDAATKARERFQSEPMPALQPDRTVAALLRPGEVLLAVRRAALLNQPAGTDAASLPGYGGRLYLTSARLLHVGQLTASIALSDIQEVSLAGEQLLLTLAEGEGLKLRVEQPRLLRVQISAARRQAAEGA